MPVQAVEHIRPMRGGAQAHLLRAEDGHYYVTKFVNNPQHRRVLANEFLAARLARGLGLPVPPAAIVDVPPRLVDGSPGLVVRKDGGMIPCASGLQFGSRFPAPDPHASIYDYLPEPGLELVANLSDFAGMLLFDKWTCNCNGRQVVYCRPGPHQRLRVYMVDQGFCFNAGDWNFPDNPLRGVYSRNCVYAGITGWSSFEPWLSRLENYEVQAIAAAGEELPPAWYGGWDDLQRLLAQLAQRRTRVRELVWAVKASPRAPFENWRDQAAGAAVQGRLG
ncbi:MAG: HipA family kinase [Terriglobales bacterium]